MNYWIKNLPPHRSPDKIGVIQLAWQRFGMGTSPKTKTCSYPLKSKDLHLTVVNEVKAKSQSKYLSQIEHLLNANEIDLIRNQIKRNSKVFRPKYILKSNRF